MVIKQQKTNDSKLLKQFAPLADGGGGRQKEEEEEKEGGSRGGRRDGRAGPGLVVQIFCVDRDAEGGCLLLSSTVIQNTPTPTNHFLWLSQNLRAQEAAQAEAEDKEDLEIAVETGGRNISSTTV